MATSGHYNNPCKSAFSFEFYDSSWELEYMKELENDHNVSKWTKNHGISIPYYDDDKTYRQYKPDFLVEYIDGSIELVEMKSTHMLNSPNTKLKKKHAEEWCEARSMKYKLISKFQ